MGNFEPQDPSPPAHAEIPDDHESLVTPITAAKMFEIALGATNAFGLMETGGLDMGKDRDRLTVRRQLRDLENALGRARIEYNRRCIEARRKEVGI